MRLKHVVTSAAVLVTLSSVFSSRLALANDGPADFIYDSAQEGQNVRLSLGILYPGGAVAIKRTGEGYEKILFEGVDLTEGAEPSDYCWHNWNDECNGEDESCSDCDGDGIAECWAECLQFYFVEYLDECVYPGENRYYLYYQFVADQEDAWIDSEIIDVVDTGEECDYDIDWGGDDGCSVSGLGSHPLPGFGLFALMLALGLVALSRRTLR